MKKKNITIDTLAGMIKRGFDNVEKRMVNKEEFNARFTEVNEQLSRIQETAYY